MQRNTEEVYMKLIEHMEEAVCMTDEKGVVLYANPKLCYLLGKTSEEIVGFSADDFLDEESRKKVAHVDKKEREKGVSSSYSISIVTKLGNIIPVNLNGTPLPGGGTIGIMTDMREMRIKEENEKILYNAVQFSTDGMIICDKEGKITFWNKGAQIIFGLRHDDTVGKYIDILFDASDIVKILNNQEGINKHELPARHKNKTLLDISMTQTPILDIKKRSISSYLLVCRDVTQYRKIEDEIESKYKKIREVYQSIGLIKRQGDYIFDLLEIYENDKYDIKSIGDFIVTSVIMLTRVDVCILRVYDKKTQKLKLISSFGAGEGWEGKNMIKYVGSLAEKAFLANIPLKIIDLNKEPKYQSIFLARKNNVTSLLLIPLKYKGECVGSLSLYAKPDKKLEIFENEFIEKYAKVIQIVIGASL